MISGFEGDTHGGSGGPEQPNPKKEAKLQGLMLNTKTTKLLQQFMDVRAPKPVLRAFTDPDQSAFNKHLRKMLRAGVIPDDWPPLLFDYDDHWNQARALDMSSAVVLRCILSASDPRSLMPTSAKDVRDWIWNPKQGIAFVWNHRDGRLQPATEPEAVEYFTRVHWQLNNSMMSWVERAPEASMSALLIAMLRTFKPGPEEFESLRTLMYNLEWSKFEGAWAEIRKTLWCSLLVQSPRFVAARCAVPCRPREEPKAKTIFYCRVLIAVDELDLNGGAELDRVAAETARRNNLLVADDAVILTEQDPAFSAYLNLSEWDSLPVSDWAMSAEARRRGEAYDAELEMLV